MQDDLTDAVGWAAASGIADAGRVCIVGASYGGYAALMGAVKTPDLYKCAVSLAGVSDLPDLIAHQSDYVLGREAREVLVGKAWGDRERRHRVMPTRSGCRCCWHTAPPTAWCRWTRARPWPRPCAARTSRTSSSSSTRATTS